MAAIEPDATAGGDNPTSVTPLDQLHKRIFTSLGFNDFQAEHNHLLSDFLNKNEIKCLYCYYDQEQIGDETVKQFIITTKLPIEDKQIDLIVYLIKMSKDYVPQIDHHGNPIQDQKFVLKTPEQVVVDTQYGIIRAPFLNSMLEKVKDLFAPTFFDTECWPDSIRNDFNSQLHRYLSMLTDQKHRIAGKTVIYVPKEGLNLDTDIAARDKEYVSRLENAMIHWTRQIKDVLNAQETNNTENGDTVGPLDEIKFWENRCNDLSGLSDQLDKPEVRKIQKILEQAKTGVFKNETLKT